MINGLRKKRFIIVVVISFAAIMLFSVAGEMVANATETPRVIAEISGANYKVILTSIGNGDSSRTTVSITSLDGNILVEKDIKHNYYGGNFRLRSMNLSKDEGGNDLILIQGEYGGDGDHTENRLLIYRYFDKRLEFVVDENISETVVKENNGVFKSASGLYILTLCDTCDGWDVSDPEDIFKLPIKLTLRDNRLERVCELSPKEKQDLLQEFKKRKDADIASALENRDEDYIKYANDVEKELLDVISDNSIR